MSGQGTYVDNTDHQFAQGDPWTLVNSRFDLTQSYAQNSFDAALSYIGEMSNMVKFFQLPSTSAIKAVDIPDLPGLSYTKRPTVGSMANISWPVNTIEMDSMLPIPVLSDVTVPTMSFVAPGWNTVDKPSLTEITPPGDAPLLGDVNIPVRPTITLPDLPVLEEILLPPAPLISLPSFDSQLPDTVLNTPEGFSYQEGQFQSDVAPDLKTKIIYDIRNGGTGLAPLVEQELVDRAQYRQQSENDRAFREIESKFGAAGFNLPPGPLAGALLEAGAQISKNNTDINGQIFIKQAELAQTNSHFVIDKGLNIWQTELDFHNQSATRALEAAKTVATIGIELFNAKITRYNAYVDKYKADAIVYESRVKAALTEVEIFKAQIEGAKVSATVQELLVSVYEKQLTAVETMAKIYATELEGSRIVADIEGQKMENYRLTTQAYVARLEGEKTKFEAYAAELQGEKVKADVYLSQVQSFVGEVEAAKSMVTLETAKADLAIKTNTSLIDKYKAELSGYMADIEVSSQKINAEIEGFKAEVAAYSAETAAEGSFYDVKAKEMDVMISNARVKLEKAVAEIDASIKGYLGLKELEVEANKGITQVTSQLASSALNAVNASASYGYSASENKDESWRHSDSLSESHSFDETPT